DSDIFGTVVLQAALPATNGALVSLAPVVVLTNPPGNLTGIAIQPNSLTPEIGESDPLQVWGNYDSRSSALFYVPPGTNVMWSSSNPSVYEVNTNGVGSALTNGTATVSATYLGYSGLADVTVNPDGYVIIIAQPQNQFDVQGQTATLSVSALGIGPLYYQWYFNNMPI